MRSCLIWFVLFIAAIAVVVIWPYRFEQPRLAIVSNTTGCKMSLAVRSGWPAQFPPPFAVWRMNDPAEVRTELYSCPGLPGGTPAAVTLTHGGKSHRGEACGTVEAALPCHVTLPAVPGRYRLVVQLKDGDAPRTIDIEVVRETIWRPMWWDWAMSV